ncbi:helix-turn-helix domain-containing protein [Umezawaea endophytica]|uniref:Helix-turn-helix transcriptional regulator n=1 Tax=Umezawaea endophytica TaxID=1654476 RepID=A0A9X2VFK9_9PSEU|nr:helix-turn-helix transcriptional regulator [Umezawaea endophytica]MCS7475691.1 helix-turn-helix transcriptional regulator [Umezawaea endophytica]
MTRDSPPRRVPATTKAGRSLGARIKAERGALSQTALADKLGWSQSKVQKIESGVSRVEYIDLMKIIEVLDVTSEVTRAMIADHSADKRPRRPRGTNSPRYFHRFLTYEQEAERVRAWSQGQIPGVLQSDAYMVAVLDSPDVRRTAELIRIREERRDVFRSNPDAEHTYVIGESALTNVRRGGPGAVAVDQVDHLVRLLDALPTLRLHVLPHSAPLRYMVPDFTLFSLTDRRRPRLYVEIAEDAMYLDDAHRVAAHERKFEELLAVSHSREDTWQHLLDLLVRLRAGRPTG